MRKKFLITGASGFAAPHLINLLLSEGHEVHGTIRGSNGRETDVLDVISEENFNKVIFHYLDLTHNHSVEKLIKENNFDGIFHLAAQSHPPTSFTDPLWTFEANIMASANIISAVQSSKTKLHFCSTSEVYGDSGQFVGLLKEDMSLTPNNPYGVSKAATDLYMQERMTNGYINGFVTRAFSHTGSKRGYRFSISSDAYQLAKIKLGLQEPVLKIGNLDTERVVIDVKDCVRAYYLLMQNDNSSGQVFNVCGDRIDKMQVYTDKLIEISGLNVVQEIEPKFYREIDIQVQIGDSTRLRNLTGWKPEIDINTTLKELYDYWIKKLS